MRLFENFSKVPLLSDLLYFKTKMGGSLLYMGSIDEGGHWRLTFFRILSCGRAIDEVWILKVVWLVNHFHIFLRFLLRCGDISLIWRFSGEILKRDEEMGAKIFTSENIPAVKPRSVIDYLRNYPKSLRIFLEFLIEKKIDEESVHTQLAMMYIDDIKRSDLNRNSPGHRMTINKLRSLLRTSQKLELVKLLEILDTPCFPHEHAIVCGRLGQHSTAINTFINYLKVVNLVT
jgi:hypothetical protein